MCFDAGYTFSSKTASCLRVNLGVLWLRCPNPLLRRLWILKRFGSLSGGSDGTGLSMMWMKSPRLEKSKQSKKKCVCSSLTTLDNKRVNISKGKCTENHDLADGECLLLLGNARFAKLEDFEEVFITQYVDFKNLATIKPSELFQNV